MIQQAQTPPAFTFPYTLNSTSGAAGATGFQPICVHAGDRLYLVSQTPNGTVIPDGTADFGAGFMPHWVYRPLWPRTEDAGDPPFDPLTGAIDHKFDGLNGNSAEGPEIRVDLEYLYCPWAGTVKIEGGRGLVDPITIIQIAYAWDQGARQRGGWWTFFMEMMNRLNGGVRRNTPIRVPRIPVDARLLLPHTLTFWNAFNDGGAPLSIKRPQMSDSVWTPDSQQLVMDNGAGTGSTTVRTNGYGNRAPLGPYSRVTAVSNSVGCIIFGVTL